LQSVHNVEHDTRMTTTTTTTTTTSITTTTTTTTTTVLVKWKWIALHVFFRYPDVVLATLLCIRANLCRRRFEIKVNDMVFVGFPMQMPATAAGSASSHSSPNTCSSQPPLVHPSPKREQSSTVSYNIVFAVKVMFWCSSILTSHLWQLDITFWHFKRLLKIFMFGSLCRGALCLNVEGAD